MSAPPRHIPSSTTQTTPPQIVPDADYLSISQEPSTGLTNLTGCRKLVILDLNGTLLTRDTTSRHSDDKSKTIQYFPVFPRPYMPTFRAYIFDDRTRAWLDTMVWSSAKPHNVDDMIAQCFGGGISPAECDGEGTNCGTSNKEDSAGDYDEHTDKRGKHETKRGEHHNFVAVWARDTFGLTESEYCESAWLSRFYLLSRNAFSCILRLVLLFCALFLLTLLTHHLPFQIARHKPQKTSANYGSNFLPPLPLDPSPHPTSNR